MPRATPHLAAFNAGEWSPRLWAREDLPKYPRACRTLENFLPLPQGPVTRRTGTSYIALTKAAGLARIIPFIFSTVQAYIIEAGNFYFRFFKDGGRIESPPGTPVEIATPYAAADLPRLKWAQSADILYLVHPSYPPKKLSRTSHTTWTLTDFVAQDGPYLPMNTTAVTITPSAATGTGITLTASAALFAAADVGSIWRLEEPTGTLPYKNWEASTPSIVSGTTHVQYNGRQYVAASSGTTGNHAPVHTEGTATDGGVQWTYEHDGAGYVRITGYTSPTQVTANVISTLPDPGATKRWRKGAWSAGQGYPSAVTFHEERLWFAGTPGQPQTLWGSASGDFENFEPSQAFGQVADDTPITVTISTDQVNAIRWLSSGDELVIGTSGGEFTLKASNQNEAITSTNITVRRQATRGVADIPPIRIGGTVLFVQRARRKLFEIGYDFQTDSFKAEDALILADHLTRPYQIAGLVWQAEPYSVLWAYRDDGALLGLTYEPTQEVYAWHRHPLGDGGLVRSLAVIPGDAEDELWMVVERIVNGSPVHYIERLSPSFYGDAEADKAAAFFVDAGLTYQGAPATTITGLGHLEGKTVAILADGAVQVSKTVAAGQIVLDRAASRVSIGLGYRSTLETVDQNAGSATGSGRGKPKRITEMVIAFFQTLGALYGCAGVALDRIPFRNAHDPMDASPPLFTGERLLVSPKGWGREARITVVQDQPLPCTVAAFTPTMTVTDV